MKSISNSIAADKSYKLSLRVISLYKYLCEEKSEFTLSKQLLRSGTSIGANIEEALGGQSKKDFLSKISIAYKECRETHYWLRLLRDSNYIDPQLAESFVLDTEELLKILTATIKTTKASLNQK